MAKSKSAKKKKASKAKNKSNGKRKATRSVRKHKTSPVVVEETNETPVIAGDVSEREPSVEEVNAVEPVDPIVAEGAGEEEDTGEAQPAVEEDSSFGLPQG